MSFTKSVTYDRPIIYKMTIRSRDGKTTYQTFTSTDTNPTIFISKTRCKLNTILSNLTFTVDNSDGSVNPTHIKYGNEILLQIAKDPAFFSDPNSYAFIGNIDYPDVEREGFQLHQFNVNAYESKKIFYDSLIDFNKSAPVTALDNPTTTTAKKFQINNLIKDALSNRLYTLLGEDSIQERFTSLALDNISDDVNIIYPRPRFKKVPSGTMLDDLADIIGFNWYLTYQGGTKHFNLKYPTEEAIPIRMISGKEKDINTDLAASTSYIVDPFRLESSASQEANFATRLSAVSQISPLVVASQTTNLSSTTLNAKAIATPFNTIETNFTILNLTLSKQGEPESPKNRVNGSIFLNVSNKPQGKVLDFAVDMDDIESKPTNVTIDLTEEKRFIENLAGFADFYIVLYQRSAKKGDPDPDATNTIRWHRDLSTAGGSLITTSFGGEREKYLQFVWQTHGPKYCFSLSSAVNRVLVNTNYNMLPLVGKIEPTPLDFSFISDVQTGIRYLSAIMYYAALFKVPVPLQVTLPDNFLFRPYQIIPNVTEEKTMPQGIPLEIQEVEYDFANNNNQVHLQCLGLIDDGFPTTWDCVALA